MNNIRIKILTALILITLALSIPLVSQASSVDLRLYTPMGTSTDIKRTQGVGWSSLGFWLTGEEFDSSLDPLNSSIDKTYVLLDGKGKSDYDFLQIPTASRDRLTVSYKYYLRKTDAVKLVEKLKLKETSPGSGKVGIYQSTIFGLDPYNHSMVQAARSKAGTLDGMGGQITLPNKTALGYFISYNSIANALSWTDGVTSNFRDRFNQLGTIDLPRNNAIISAETTDGTPLTVYHPSGKYTIPQTVTAGFYGQIPQLHDKFTDINTGISYYLTKVYFEPSDKPVEHRLFRKAGNKYEKTDVKTNGGASAKYGSAAYNAWFNKVEGTYYRMGTEGTNIYCVYKKLDEPPTPTPPKVSEGVEIEYIIKDFEDPFPIAEIAAMDMGNSKFDVDLGIPSSEKVYAQANTEEFLIGYRLKGTKVTRKFKIPVIYYYDHLYDEYTVTGFDKDGKPEWGYVPYSTRSSATSTQEVVRVYQYWEVEEFEAYKPGVLSIKNDATNTITVNPTLASINSSFEKTHSFSKDNEVWDGKSIEVETGVSTYDTYTPSASDAKTRAEAAVKQYKVKNDTLVFKGQTIMSGTQVEGIAIQSNGNSV